MMFPAKYPTFSTGVLFSTLILSLFPHHSESFDIISSLLSQTPNLSEKLPLPNLKSLIGSSEAVQKMLQNKGLLPFMSAEAAQTNHIELNKLLAQLKPKQGRLDPAVIDLLSHFDNYGAGARSPNIFSGSAEPLSHPSPLVPRRVPTSTEESSVIWPSTMAPVMIVKRQGNVQVRRKTVPSVKTKFSAKFRNETESNKTHSHTKKSHRNANNLTTTTSESPKEPKLFEHITDPNIRNHRLYDWEFETYKNFTHIDQAEDLMAMESEPSEVVVRPTPASVEAPKVATSTIIPSGWIPKPGRTSQRGPKRPVSMEGSRLDVEFGVDDIAPGTYMKLPIDSEEPKPPREPLRESSTENLVYASGSSEDRNRFNRYRQQSSEGGQNNHNGAPEDFRPSQPELSPPVFVDPEQDFFTSTIRGPSDERTSDEYLNGLPGFKPPRRRHRKRFRTHDVKHPDRRDRNRADNISSGDHPQDPQHHFYSDEDDHFRNTHDRANLARDRLESGQDQITEIHRNDQPKQHDDASDENMRLKDERNRYDIIDDKGLDTGSRERPRLEYRPEIPRITSSKKSDRILNQQDVNDKEEAQPNGAPFQKKYRQKPNPGFIPAQADMNQFAETQNMPYYESQYPPQDDQGLPQEQSYNGDDNYQNNYNNNDNSNSNSNTNDMYQNGYYESNPQYELNYNNEYSGGGGGSLGGKSPNDQIYAGGYDQQQYNHPFQTEESHQYSPYSEKSWSNTYFILGGLIALSALSAFLIPTLLSTMGRQGKVRNDLDDLSEAYLDENTSTSPSNINVPGGKPTYQDTDPTSDPDLWSEIKGVYNDVVKIVRGDYGGIVDKLSGSSTDKTATIPNIVYRDEEDDEQSEEIEYNKHRNDRQSNNKKGKKPFDKGIGNEAKVGPDDTTILRKRKGHYNSEDDTTTEDNLDDDGDDSTSGSSEDTTSSSASSSNNNNNKNNRKNNKNRTINSSINYVVQNGGYPTETSRGVPTTFGNGTMITGFQLANSSMPFHSSTTEGFLGEWAKVQLIGN